MERSTTLHGSRRGTDLDVGTDAAWHVVASGAAGSQWYVDAAPLVLRGAIDRVLGGDGRRWPPPGRELLETGDRAGFWRVSEADHAGRRLTLVASVRAPGSVVLRTTVTAVAAGGSRIDQEVGFSPAGLLGRAYLLADLPAREAVVELVHRRLVGDVRRSAARS